MLIATLGAQTLPQAGKPFTIRYDAEQYKVFKKPAKLEVVWVFDYWGTKRYQSQGSDNMFLNVLEPDSGRAQRMAMKKEGKVWTAAIEIPQDAALLSYYITDGKTSDYNQKLTFLEYINGEDGKPVRNARYRKLDFMFMAGMGEAERYALIREELADYPDNFMALIPCWILRLSLHNALAFDSLMIFRDEALSRGDEFQRAGMEREAALNYQAGVHLAFYRSLAQSISNKIYPVLNQSDSIFMATMALTCEEKRDATLNKYYQEKLAAQKEQEASVKFAMEILGKPAPDFSATDLDGRAIQLSALKGKVVLLEFWATWCGPCKAFIPKLKEAYQKYHDQGLEIISISADAFTANKNSEEVKQFATEHEMAWNVVLDATIKELHSLYKVFGWPTLYLIDGDGKIVASRSERIRK